MQTQNATKTYTARSSAVRGARRALGKNAKEGKDFKVKARGDVYVFDAIQTKAKTPRKTTRKTTRKTSPAPVVRDPKMKGITWGPGVVQNRSECESPVFIVWDLCEKMRGARRKEVIAAAMEKGVTWNTARSQYQYWYQANKRSGR